VCAAEDPAGLLGPWLTMWISQLGHTGSSDWIAHSKLSKVRAVPFIVTLKALS
jgi:hypothetical protein